MTTPNRRSQPAYPTTDPRSQSALAWRKAGRVLVALALLFAGYAVAQECTYEVEPNDALEAATVVTGAGPTSLAPSNLNQTTEACLSGTMGPGDTDLYRWTPGELGAGHRWVVDLEGSAGQNVELTVTRAVLVQNGRDVESITELLRLTADGAAAASPEFLVDSDTTYVVSVTGGAGEYVAGIRPVTALRYGVGDERFEEFLASRTPEAPFGAHAVLEGEIGQTFTIPADMAGYEWDLELWTSLGSEVAFTLAGPSGTVTSGATAGDGWARADDLELAQGQYTLTVTGEPDGLTSVRYQLEAGGRSLSGAAVEPNDTWVTAGLIRPGESVDASLSNSDYYRLEVDAAQAARPFDVTLTSGSDVRLAIRDRWGRDLREPRAGDATGLTLAAGVYRVIVDGSSGASYRLAVTPSNTTRGDVEPNDTLVAATPIGPTGVVDGTFTGRDTDTFALTVSGEAQLYGVHVETAAGEWLRLLDAEGTTIAEARDSSALRIDDVLLMPGTHYLSLRGSNAEYRLTAAPVALVPPPGILEIEPNDDESRAIRLQVGETHVGRLTGGSDDYYRFHLTADQYVRLTVTPPADSGGIRVYIDNLGWREPPTTDVGAVNVVEEFFLAGDHTVSLRGPAQGSEGYYQLTMELLGALVPPAGLAGGDASPPHSQLSVELTAPVDAVAAFWHEGQTVELTASVRNDGQAVQTVDLRVASSNAAITFDAPDSVSVPAGQTVTVPVTARIPSDLRDDVPLRFEVAAGDATAATSAAVSLAAYCEAPAIGAARYWPLPDTLVGKPNVLWSGLGGTPYESVRYTNRDLQLIDGRTSPAAAGYFGPDSQPTYLLAGSGPVTLVGTILNPQVGNDVASQLRGFRIETSLDGVSFTTAFEGELTSARIEQAFEFERPVTARYARLVGIDSQGGRDNGYLGEWKLVAMEAPFESAHVSDPAVGGHVVWAVPFVSAHGISLLTAGDSPRTVDVRDTGRFEFVVAFRDGRAGQVERFEWLDAAGTAARSEQEQVAGVVGVAVSMAGGAGPWEELVDWELERDADGRAELVLAEPVWARYVRFTVTPDEGVRFIYVPDAVSVYERAVSDAYPSLLGEYGNVSRAAVYEYLNPPSAAAVTDTDAGDSRQEATPLSGGVATGTVNVAEDVDWYRLTIPAGSNHLSVHLTGDPQVGYRYELQDAAGVRVDHEERPEGDGIVLTYFGEPGDYYLLIEEPKRTVVFVWDTSGSVGAYLPITYNSLARFAADVSSEREAVQLLAFNDPDPKWLLPFWSSDTLRVQRAIVEFDRQADSSNSETSLLVATKALADREGTRAILLITDAESGSENLTPELWEAFEEVRPRIFTFEISSGGNDYAQDLMQDWADVNGGVYTLATGVGDFDMGFSRASCILRRPKGYRVEVTASHVEPPGPGTLQVMRAAGAAQPAVEVIFDASGSMGRELPSGEQRITAAKRALQVLVNEVLPEGTPFSLRAFGHIAPSSCETRLDVTLAPLDRAKAAAAVAVIEPKLLSQTPLADSLTAVAADMASATAGRTVVLITDGVESCGGDPAAAVAALRSNGFEFDLAIVSLALEPDALATFTSLAESVGASYVDVTSFEELSASIEAALNPEFEVVDASGAVVARGRVGDAGVSLPMGTYTVRVMGEEHTGVRVPGDALVTLSVGTDARP